MSALARVQPVEWWKEPLTYPPYQQESLKQLFGYISAEGGFALWSVGDIDGVTLAGDAHELRHDLFVVPPDATAMFEVRVEFSYYLDSNAWVAINFAEPYFAIANHLQLELLTTPSPINALRDP